MRKIWIVGLLMAVVLISGCYGTQKTTTPTAEPRAATVNSVEIKGFAFNPATITVAKGTTVTWTNKDSAAHTVTGSGFDSGSLSKGQTFSYTFNEAGTFDYICTIHPSMKGKVIVTE